MQLVGDAHLVAGGKEVISHIIEILESSGIDTRGNPDIFLREYMQFGIDEAREIAERACLRALGDGQRVFIIAAPSMTAEAQNALLKTLEEPAAEALFFLIVPSPETLLPTLRSRMQNLSLSGTSSVGEIIDANEFLRASPHRRISMLKPLLERDEEERRDVGAIIKFLSTLERAMSSANGGKEGLPAQAGLPASQTSFGRAHAGLHAVYRARKYILDKGAIHKTLLEQVALLI